MSEQNHPQPAPPGPAFEYLVQTIAELRENPFAVDAEARLSAAAYAANAEMYGTTAR